MNDNEIRERLRAAVGEQSYPADLSARAEARLKQPAAVAEPRARALGLVAAILAIAIVAALVGPRLVANRNAQPSSTATETPSPVTSPSPSAEPTPFAITGPTLHMGEVGLAYAPVTYQATGGNPPYIVWTVSDGALPGGLSLSLDGIISGTPTASGTFNFTVEINDSSLAVANLSGAINVAPRLTLNYVGEMAANGSVSVCTGGGYAHCWTDTPDNRYAPFAAVRGGAPPYTYSVVSGALPPGTTLNGLALAGTFPGDTSGTYRFTVAVTDSLGATTTIVVEYYLWYHRNLPPPSP